MGSNSESYSWLFQVDIFTTSLEISPNVAGEMEPQSACTCDIDHQPCQHALAAAGALALAANQGSTQIHKDQHTALKREKVELIRGNEMVSQEDWKSATGGKIRVGGIDQKQASQR